MHVPRYDANFEHCYCGAAQALAVAWLIDHGIGTQAQRSELFELGRTLHEQGTDWVSKTTKTSVQSAE